MCTHRGIKARSIPSRLCLCQRSKAKRLGSHVCGRRLRYGHRNGHTDTGMRNRAITRASISGSICSFSFLQPLGSGRYTSLGVSAHVQQEELTYRARPGMHRECDHATLGSSRNAGPTLEDFRACRIHRKQSFSVLNNNFNTHTSTTYSHCAEGKAPRNRMTTLVLIQICIETKQGWSAY